MYEAWRCISQLMDRWPMRARPAGNPASHRLGQVSDKARSRQVARKLAPRTVKPRVLSLLISVTSSFDGKKRRRRKRRKRNDKREERRKKGKKKRKKILFWNLSIDRIFSFLDWIHRRFFPPWKSKFFEELRGGGGRRRLMDGYATSVGSVLIDWHHGGMSVDMNGSNGVVARLGTHRRIAGTEITQGTRLINSVVQRNIIPLVRQRE